MAKVQYSALIGGIAGSVGGVTFRGGGAGGIVSARVGGKRSFTLAQLRQQAIMGEARRDFESLDDIDRRAFEFSVGEGYAFRPESGVRFSNARAAYAAWYVAGRYMGANMDFYKDVAVMRRYGSAKPTYATAAVTPAVSFRFYASNKSAKAPYGLWMARAASATALPSRPVWKLIYSAGFDPPIEEQASGLPSPRQWYAEFGPYVAARCSFFVAGQVIAYKWVGPSVNNGIGPSGVKLIQL